MDITNQLKDVNSVAQDRTALIVVPNGPRYKSITLVLGDTAKTGTGVPTVADIIGEIRCNYLNGIQRRVTGTQLDVINTAMGAGFASQAYTGASGNGLGRRHLTLYFWEPWRKRSFDQDALAWQTGFFGKGDRFLIEVDIKPTATSGTPLLTAYAKYDYFNGGKPHSIMKWDKNDIPAIGTPIEYAKLDRKDAYSQFSLFDTSDAKTIDRVRLTQGAVEIHDLTSAENTTLLKNNDMNPAAGAYHVVFDLDDNLQSVVPAQSLQLTATPSASAAGTLPLIAQRLGLPE